MPNFACRNQAGTPLPGTLAAMEIHVGANGPFVSMAKSMFVSGKFAGLPIGTELVAGSRRGNRRHGRKNRQRVGGRRKAPLRATEFPKRFSTPAGRRGWADGVVSCRYDSSCDIVETLVKVSGIFTGGAAEITKAAAMLGSNKPGTLHVCYCPVQNQL